MDPVTSNQPVLRLYHVRTWCYLAQDFAVSPLFITVMVIWPGVHKLSRFERGYVSASSFVIVSFGFSSPTQMLVTDYGYRWYRLAQQSFGYCQVRLCSLAEKPLCWGVSHTLRRSIPMVQETSEEVWFFKHLLGLLNGSLNFTGSSSIIRRPGKQLETIGLGKIQKFLRGILPL